MTVNRLFSIFFLCSIFSLTVIGQTIKGKIVDVANNPLFGAYIIATEQQGVGGVSNESGEFAVTPKSFPVKLRFTYLGFEAKELLVSDATKFLTIVLESSDKVLKGATVKASRISEKEKEQPLTVESMGLAAIKDAPTATFYESLGNMKGVDITAASLGFRVINTRGFNSTSPVRSLQVIDGVDNQSPGLNFSLGNFLGAGDLDIRKVDIVAGASGAYFGPNAFNGVVSMTTKNPFDFHGLSVDLKAGERNLGQFNARWADYFTNSKGEKKFGYKINILAMTAYDWEAENYDPVEGTAFGIDNPGGYDAVNIYGDEILILGSDYTSPVNQFENPGLGYFHRTGYREIDLIDYTTNNVKFNTGLYYKFRPNLELSYNFNISGGSTVYQGDNRYRLENIRFWQNVLQLEKKDDYFVRFYSTNEDGGNSYDLVSTGFRLNELSKTNEEWNRAYAQNWRLFRFRNQVQGLPDYPNYNIGIHDNLDNWAENFLNPFLAQNQDSLFAFHNRNKQLVDNAGGAFSSPRYEPGTERFDSAFSDITGRLFTENGTRFFDQSALYHLHGEKKFDHSFALFTVGANGRLYRPNSQGTIFEDTGNVQITNYEYGLYGGLEKRVLNNRLIISAVTRLDKNQNFNFLVSPAASLVYKVNSKDIIRLSLSSAIRNPTLSDQYLYYDVGRARLLGNLNGFDSLITVESFNEYRAVNLDLEKLEYFDVAPIRPEQARSIEVGYKGSFFDKSLYIDAEYYYTFYKDFIGYNIGLAAQFDPNTRFPMGGIEAYRIAANATSVVTTQGFSFGASYYFKKYALTGNYSWNVLNKRGADDPIIPAFNTPAHKFNIGFNGSKIKLPFVKKEQFGFGMNYKFIEGFIFEGSPQFTGFIPSYDMFDAQINYYFDKINSTVKLGGSNLFGFSHLFQGRDFSLANMFNNRNYQVYGGPMIGRLVYISVLYEFKPNKNKKVDEKNSAF